MIATNHPSPLFRVGQLVAHRRYGYRGVVVACDSFCKAPENWYRSNQTQPDRNQPWYHVLVDQARTSTYVAQSNLEIDSVGGPVDHPLVDHFFSEFTGQAYVRNELEWPLT